MTSVRRIHAGEWREVKALRLRALADPIANLAFLETLQDAEAQPDSFWQDRARNSAEGDDAAQFVAESVAGDWLGTVTVLRHRERAGAGLVVGVFVLPEQRGAGTIDALLDAAARWAGERGWSELVLEVHIGNPRAVGAYERCGFTRTGELTEHVNGTEYVMSRPIAATVPRRLLLVNGPNLNLLGTREPEIYGTATLHDVERLVADTAAELGFEIRAVQSNHEGVLIDAIHAARGECAGIVINPGGLTHTSVVLRDALTGVMLPFAEVHISNVLAREQFRHHSYLHDVAAVRVIGEGVAGYGSAVRQLIALIP